jgi:hypothetical protein
MQLSGKAESVGAWLGCVSARAPGVTLLPCSNQRDLDHTSSCNPCPHTEGLHTLPELTAAWHCQHWSDQKLLAACTPFADPLQHACGYSMSILTPPFHLHSYRWSVAASWVSPSPPSLQPAPPTAMVQPAKPVQSTAAPGPPAPPPLATRQAGAKSCNPCPTGTFNAQYGGGKCRNVTLGGLLANLGPRIVSCALTIGGQMGSGVSCALPAVTRPPPFSSNATSARLASSAALSTPPRTAPSKCSAGTVSCASPLHRIERCSVPEAAPSCRASPSVTRSDGTPAADAGGQAGPRASLPPRCLPSAPAASPPA